MTKSGLGPAGGGSPQLDGLLDVPGLLALVGQPDVCILDCRYDLLRAELGLEQYRQAHIPGAFFAHLDRDLSGVKDGGNGRHPLPEPQALVTRLRSWGVRSTTRVIAYDASESSFAARAWWLLRWLGHERVAVLDGGWPAWLAAGGPTSTREPVAEPGDIVRRPALQATVSLESVVALVQAAQSQSRPQGSAAAAGPARRIVDARAPDRYEGRNETVDPVAGHIPGAVNRFWKLNLDERGRFKTPEQLHAEYAAILAGLPADVLVLQCGSGVTACHDLLALHLARLPGAALFPGSWSQWVADPSRPVALGPAPG
jgi:thiosulfate/3-mercaptopyruvate sulfurtransferase